MDIKEKFKEFIDKQKISIKSQQTLPATPDVNIDELKSHLAVTANHSHQANFVHEFCLTNEAEQAVIDSIDKHYFEESKVDIAEQELLKFPDIADVHVINGIRSRLRKQQSIVVRRASNLIMEKQALCTAEILQMTNLQQELCKCINLCVEGRENLQVGKSRFTSSSLGILSSYNKRQRVASVIDALKTIHTLQMTDVHLQKLLKSEDYPGAIQLLLECQKAAETFKHFKCISDLSTKLQETLEMAEEQLDGALSKIALDYCEEVYAKLYLAYELFGKTQTFMDQLHMHLTSHIHNSAFIVILGYAELYNRDFNGSGLLSKLQYSELCKNIHDESFLACFIDLSKTLWHLLVNYKNIMKFHALKEKESDDLELNKYIKQKLDHGLIRVWQDVQAKIRTYVLASNLAHFKFDDFLKVLAIINKVIDVGEAFCGSKSETLQDSVKKQSFSFFRTHHLARMEELHMFLENEGWAICPVKSNFSIASLIEPNFLINHSSICNLTPDSSPRKEHKNIFDMYGTGSPFDIITENATDEDILSSETIDGAISEDSDDDIPEELKKDFVDEHTGEQPDLPIKKKKHSHNVPMATNTTVTILRLFGKYVQMMELLQPIAFDVCMCLKQLFEYFLYAVFVLFSERRIDDLNISMKLQETLQRIEEDLILDPSEINSEKNENKLPRPYFSHQVLLNQPDNIYDFPVRVIAAESLHFLAKQLESLQPKMEILIPPSKSTFLQQFYTNSVQMTDEVRCHVYSYVAGHVVDYDTLLSHMQSVKWDISDLKSEHNSYVDMLVRQLQELARNLEKLQQNHVIPTRAITVLWENVIKQVNRTLLEGFSLSKKCTNEGRSLMQLDYQQFLLKLEQLTTIRPIPDRILVDTYVKAYYLPEESLVDWVEANLTSYSSKQFLMLVNCMSHVSKRTKQRIASLLEEKPFSVTPT